MALNLQIRAGIVGPSSKRLSFLLNIKIQNFPCGWILIGKRKWSENASVNGQYPFLLWLLSLSCWIRNMSLSTYNHTATDGTGFPVDSRGRVKCLLWHVWQKCVRRMTRRTNYNSSCCQATPIFSDEWPCVDFLPIYILVKVTNADRWNHSLSSHPFSTSRNLQGPRETPPLSLSALVSGSSDSHHSTVTSNP